MARHPVTELWVQRQGTALVRVTAQGPAVADKGDLRAWVDRSSVPASAMLGGGLALGIGGVGLAVFGPAGLAAAAMFSAMITLGGGLTFLGLLKRKPPPPEPAPVSTTSREVRVERARRVHATLSAAADATFETLLRQLGWTEAALLETLMQMKEGGTVEEDLNLDTGEWVYRVRHDYATGAGGGLMLEDRKAIIEAAADADADAEHS